MNRIRLHGFCYASEFERELIRERSMAGLRRYRGQYNAAEKVGKEVHSRSGKNLPVGRPRRIFDREQIYELRKQHHSYRKDRTAARDR